MIHGYHVIMPMYGFWLPNDPRGSWSDFVRKWELVRFGRATKRLERIAYYDLTDDEKQQLEKARAALTYPPVSIDGLQALSIANGFATMVSKSRYTFWACSILPEHTHLVIARHTYKVESIINLLKGASTTQIIDDKRHPLAAHAKLGKKPPRMWAARGWKEYLDSEESILNAIHYVDENPVKEGKQPQRWSFVTPFAGLSKGGWITYH